MSRHRQVESFSPDVSRKLGWYVYRLIDPRNGETFYVGKGQGNRVFSHIHAAGGLEGDELDNKIKRIRQIQLAGFEVAHVIHRHGMDERTAFEVEAALIDAYPGLTNIAGGSGSNDYGAMHAKEIIGRYAAEPAVFEDKALLIRVNRSAAERSLYEATRYARRPGKRTWCSQPCRGSSSAPSSRVTGFRRPWTTSLIVKKCRGGSGSSVRRHRTN